MRERKKVCVCISRRRDIKIIVEIVNVDHARARLHSSLYNRNGKKKVKKKQKTKLVAVPRV